MGAGTRPYVDLGGKPMLAHVIERLLAAQRAGDQRQWGIRPVPAFGLPVIARYGVGFRGSAWRA